MFRKTALFLVLTLLIIACKQGAKEGDCVHEKAYLYLTVIDAKGNKVDKAIVNIFDSFEQYEKARVEMNNASYASGSYKSSSTEEIKIPVEPYVEHWILVSKYDSSEVKYFSSETSTSKLDKLQSCSDYHASVNLASSGGTVAFWTASTANLNIKIKFNNVQDSLTQAITAVPTNPVTPGSPKQVNFVVKAGTYQYQATAAGNCTWQGEVTIADGDFKTVQLEACERTTLAFYVESGVDANKYPLTVYIDNNPSPVGKINGQYSGATIANSCSPSPSASPNVLYVTVESGVAHTYKVVSQAGGTTPCTWSNSTPVLGANCSSNAAIKLTGGCN